MLFLTRCGNRISLVQASGRQSPKFVIHCMGRASYIVWSGWGGSYIVWGRLSHIVWEGCHTLYGVGGVAIHCMKGRRVPEVVDINPELRYEFGFTGGTISVSESHQFRKRFGRLYFIIKRCIMHFISKLSLTNFMKIRFREPEVVTIHPGLRYEV